MGGIGQNILREMREEEEYMRDYGLPTSLRVTVTALDFALGSYGSPYACPVARAFKRRFPNLTVSVSTVTVALRDGRGELVGSYRLPTEADELAAGGAADEESGELCDHTFTFEREGGACDRG
jgi:hypothetical protein